LSRLIKILSPTIGVGKVYVYFEESQMLKEKMARNLGFVVVGLLLSLLWSAEVAAQATAQITGSVKDQSGAVLPGVDVTVTQTDTGITRNTVTNENGAYVLPNLPIGPYRLDATLSGFRSYSQTGIVLQVNSSPVIDVALGLGDVAETVTVQANTALVETRSTGVGQVMENQRILELPLNGRQVTDLITLAGGAVQQGASRANNSAQMGGSPFIAVGGGLQFGVGYTLDGANHVNFTNGTTMAIPFPDALQEFKVETSGLSAQHGKETAVNAVTKSGTNAFHGDAFEFLRDARFNARPYFSKVKNEYQRNQFGGTLGGPIVQSKAFFFAGVQSTRLREFSGDNRVFLPTASVLQGNWTTFASPTCNAGRQLQLRGGFNGNTIDPSRYSPAALEILRRLNQVGPEPCGEVTFGRQNNQDETQVVGRVDYQLNNNHSIFGRYMSTKFGIDLPLDYSPNNLLNSTAAGQDNPSHSLALGYTSVFGANTVNEFRVSYNRLNAVVLGPELFSLCDAGVKMYCGDWPTSLMVSTGQATAGALNLGSRFPATSHPLGGDRWKSTSFLLSNDMTLVRGSHQLGFGGSFMQGEHLTFSRWWGIGNMAFGGQVTGLALADFLTGQGANMTTAAGAINHQVKSYQVALNARDIWQVAPRVTLNYGLRWEPYLPQQVPTGNNYQFDLDRFRAGVKSTVFKNAPAGLLYYGDEGFANGTAGINKQWKNVSPRVGVAWDVTGDGRTSMRAAWAYQYDYVTGLWREDYSTAAPFGNFMTVNGVGLDNPWANFPGGNPFPATIGPDVKFVPYTNFQSMPSDVDTPTVSSFNLTFQRQFGTDWSVSASYIGTRAKHLWAQRAGNPAVYIPGNCLAGQYGLTVAGLCSTVANTNQRRALGLEKPSEGLYIGALSILEDDATQDYDGLLLSGQRRVANGLTVSANYTLSKCFGDYWDSVSAGPPADETYTNPANRDADRGPCNTDRRHALNLTAVASTPDFSNTTAHMLLSGWRLSGIYRWASGAPVNVILGNGQDAALSGTLLQRPNQVLDDPYKDKSGKAGSQWLNPAAFAVPALGTYGNAGRNSVLAPPTWSFDMGLSRVFGLPNSNKIEARLEAYNVTNSFRPFFPPAGGSSGAFQQNLNAPTFGQLRDSFDPRVLQLALKYMF